MHSVLEAIPNELDQVGAQILSSMPSDESVNIANGNWTFPGVTRKDLAKVATTLASFIRDRDFDDLGENAQTLQDFPRRLQFMRGNLLGNIWSNAAAAVPSYLSTLEALRVSLPSEAAPDVEVLKIARRNAARVRLVERDAPDWNPIVISGGSAGRDW